MPSIPGPLLRSQGGRGRVHAPPRDDSEHEAAVKRPLPVHDGLQGAVLSIYIYIYISVYIHIFEVIDCRKFRQITELLHILHLTRRLFAFVAGGAGWSGERAHSLCYPYLVSIRVLSLFTHIRSTFKYRIACYDHVGINAISLGFNTSSKM